MPKVTFQKSGVTTDWDAVEDSLLELGESQGLDLDFGCRAGNCTMCQHKLVSGEVDYPFGHAADPDEGNILLCCSTPKTDVVIDA
ncbi:2Fe-2S iron-sulfur cluster-binding protein [Cerasicoccus maritimus]|uniref:2Fe-2S iron-sulfur cluster-binding protein n=1 Tax=Cerasicoccus maritimus TaxID=490089 RepID=UPI00285284B7|nr:2Fe-2S iron-sulfur cluster-binding protein [Cerasicoccus maritimus]